MDFRVETEAQISLKICSTHMDWGVSTIDPVLSPHLNFKIGSVYLVLVNSTNSCSARSIEFIAWQPFEQLYYEPLLKSVQENEMYV